MQGDNAPTIDPTATSGISGAPGTSGAWGGQSDGGSGRSAFSDLAPPARPLPERIGGYRIVRVLGEGGMGVVYLATAITRPGSEETSQRPVALKVLRRGLSVDDVLMRFHRERMVLGGLDHPNIARLLDAGETDSAEPFFVMEYVDGLPIDEFCDVRRLTIPERIELFRAVCAAVHHAHQHLVVHRDIKPRNIMVTADGVPKLLDFGIAKIIQPGEASGPDLPTAPEARPMTPEYASPEQLRGLPVSTATDIYSLGVVLYELLTGHRPFRLHTRALREVERVVCEEEPERPSEAVSRVELACTETPDDELLPDRLIPARPSRTPDQIARTRNEPLLKLTRSLRGDLDNIVLMALRKEPQRRYHSADALAEDLRRHLAGHPVIAAPDSFRYRAVKFVTRNRAGVIAAATVAVTLVVASAAFAWQAQVARRERAEAMAQRDRADRRFEELRSLAKVFLFEVYDEINRLQGSTPARQLLVKEGLSYLDGLAAEASEDPTLLEEVAAGYHRLGDVQGGLRTGHLGDTAGALKSYEHARRIRAELARARPGDPRALASLAVSTLAAADIRRRQGDDAEALELYGEAVAIQEALLAARPDDADRKRSLATALQSEGDLHLKLGDLEAAKRIYDRSVAIRRELHAVNRDDRSARRDLATALLRLGRVAELAGQPDAALVHYRDNLEIRQALADSAPGDGRLLRDLLNARRVLGDLLRARGSLDEALQEHEAAMELARRLSDIDPANARARLDLAVAHDSLGRTCLAKEDKARAAASFAAAAELADELRRNDPDDRIAAQVAAAAHESAAESCADPAAALAHQRQALEIRRRMLSDAETSAQADGAGRRLDLEERLALARACASLGRLLVAGGELAEARSALRESLAAYDLIVAQEGADESVKSDRMEVAVSLAALDGR